MRTATQAVTTPASRGFRLRTLFYRIGKRISLIYTISCERREMKKMSADTLRDIGINQSELNRELSRSFLDVPDNRKSPD